MAATSIDIIIPSYRLEAQYLLPLLQLQRPAATIIHYYVIADNPAVVVAPAIQQLVNNDDIKLLINEHNLGAAVSRNKGIDSGQADWILFLDDDIIVPPNLLETYAAAIQQYPDATGFIGLVNLPPAQDAFTRAIQVSGSMDIFSIAQRKPAYAWGATANFLISRNAISDIRFSHAYPKAGGGEDVDFFLKVRAHNQYKDYQSLPAAAVLHPWWNQGRVNYKRPFRYGIGNSYLAALNPAYTYYDWLNTPETLLLTMVAIIIAGLLQPTALPLFACLLAGIVVIECIATTVQAIKRRAPLQPAVYVYLLLLRLSYETGVLWGNLARGRIKGFGERFNDNCRMNKLKFYRTSSYRITKWVLYLLLTWWLFTKFR
ncbi:glycosyltransferase family 2 protein [Deminuibacter soli]|uniref:Glycosyltransferase family 2 protein n=1 Tax=Deminuibacter soli TaxID=2291815 RepID=A0A3E1NIQ6_9BACT|nr:glycosyltransferase [Deminuibacter soli]RFM27819.1 glycosyltransferase family 2 protein [Deminuibacter soli]